jgi:uncharacterized protein YigE (DUF2233 family)
MRRSISIILFLFLLLHTGCGAASVQPTSPPTRAVPTLFPTAIVRPAATAQPAVIGAPDSGWQSGRPGVELRHMQAAIAPDRAAVPLVVVRLDLALVRLRVAYTPEQPRGIRSWFAARQPLVAINGSFFTPEYQATALLISDGSISGESYAGFGGMLAVAPDGSVTLRALRDQIYDPAESLDQALQSFPMLVFPGGEPAAIEDDGRRARRSVVALDRAGRLLLLVSPTSDFTLRGLADWLGQSDLEVDRALNLDGGSSTGLYLNDGALQESIDSFGPLPIVLLVESR